MKRACAVAFALLLVAPFAHADEDDLARARFLDQQGVKAFGESRYRDAIALFNESFKAGGPPNELWNVARCQLKLEDIEGARHTLEKYLEQELSAEDRREGKRLQDELEHRASTFVAASTPQGAFVMVDGHVVGMTPLASTLAPGEHDIEVSRSVGSSDGVKRHVDVHDGRPVVLSVELAAEHHERKHASKPMRFSAELGGLAEISVLGGGTLSEVTGGPEMSLGYAAFVSKRLRVGFGLRFRGSFDAWSTSAGVSNTTTGCAPPTDYSAFELLAMPTVFGSLRVAKRVQLGARLGIGASLYVSGAPIGGDLFAPACEYGGSLAPDGYAAFDVSIELLRALRLVLFPVTFDVHASFVGARSDAVVDATGAWVRVGFGAALAVDL